MDTDNTPQNAGDAQPEKKEAFPKSIKLEYETQPLIDLADAINQQTNSQKIAANSGDSIGDRQIKAQKEGNRIAKRSMYVTAVLGGFTIIAIVISARALNEASRAADAAIRADSISIAALRWDSIKNADASASDSVKFQKQFGMAKQSLGAQIDAFQRGRQQFELENKPYLQISDIKIDSLSPNKIVQISYFITNYGRQPAIIQDYKYKLDISFARDFKDERSIAESNDLNNILIPPNTHADGTVSSTRVIAADEYSRVITNKEYIYVMGQVIYLDPVTKKKRIYTFDVSPYGFPKYGTRAVVNTDVEYHGRLAVKKYKNPVPNK